MFVLCCPRNETPAIAKDEPQAITCADLRDKGPGDNAHIRLQDFLLCSFAYVYEERSPGNWSKVWVPAVPIGGAYHQQLLTKIDAQGNLVGDLPMPTNVKVIVKSSDVTNVTELQQLADQETLQGMVVNLVDSLGGEEKKLLHESYPSVNFDDCYIVEIGRTPASAGKLMGFAGGGLALLTAGGEVCRTATERIRAHLSSHRPRRRMGFSGSSTSDLNVGKNQVAGVDWLLVDGNVNVGKDKGPGKLLFTRTSLFAFRVNNNAQVVGAAVGGLLGALLVHVFSKLFGKSKPPSPHLEHAEIRCLDEKIKKRIDGAALLATMPLNRDLEIERSRLGFVFTQVGETPVIYQGFFQKDKITGFLVLLGIDVRVSHSDGFRVGSRRAACDVPFESRFGIKHNAVTGFASC